MSMEKLNLLSEGYEAEEREEFAPVRTKKRLKAGPLDYLFMLSAGEQAAVLLLFLCTFCAGLSLFGNLALKLSFMGLGYKVRLSGSGLLFVMKMLMKGSLNSLIVTVLISLGIAFLVSAELSARLARIPGDTLKRAKGAGPSCDWLNYDPESLINTFEVTDMRHPEGVPLCTYKGKLFCIPDEPSHSQFKNQNVCIIGGSGYGKSYGGIEPILMTKVAAGDSFICTDTKGALYKSYKSLCEKFGYKVYQFNTKINGWGKSDAWNCLSDIVNSSGPAAWDKVNLFAECFIRDSGVSKDKKDYWSDNEQDLLRSCLHYICKSESYRGKRTFEGLMAFVNSGLEEITETFSCLPQADPARVSAAAFIKQKDDRLKESYLSGLTNKMSIFKPEVIQAALSYDSIDFSKCTQEKTAIFLVTDDSNGTYDMISSLFVTFAYNKLVEIADSRSHEGKLRRPFWLILDELCNMAAINDLSRKISTNRSRNIHIIFAIQSFSQLVERYRILWTNIMANAGTTVFFGCQDEETASWISRRCGKVKVLDTSEMRDAPAGAPRFTQAFSVRKRTQVKEEDLLPEYRARALGDACIVCVADRPAFYGAPYPAHKHPLSRFAEDTEGSSEPAWIDEYLKEHRQSSIFSETDYRVSEYEKEERNIRYEPEEEKDLSRLGSVNLSKGIFEDEPDEEFYRGL